MTSIIGDFFKKQKLRQLIYRNHDLRNSWFASGFELHYSFINAFTVERNVLGKIQGFQQHFLNQASLLITGNAVNKAIYTKEI